MTPPSPSRRDNLSPAASHRGFLYDVEAWCSSVLAAGSVAQRLPRLDHDVDEVAVERACNGDRSVTLNRPELAAAWRRLERRGFSVREVAATLGVTSRTVVRWRQGEYRPYPRRTVGVLAARRGLAS